MSAPGQLRVALAQSGFRRLLTSRLVGEFGDGIFQASLAGTVLFNPERQAGAADIAAGFAVVLIPYSFVGPFAGVLIDRWRRRSILVRTNLLRAVVVGLVAVEIAAGVSGAAFYASALVAVSLSRFVLSTLSAAQPHVVEPETLVKANALSSTTGIVATSLGGGAAIVVRALTHGGNTDYAVIALSAALVYVLAAVPAHRFAPDALGPDEITRARRESAVTVARGLVAGARHVRERRHASAALVVISMSRLCAGLTTVCTILLYRNYFTPDGIFRTGLGGLGQVLAALAIGGGLAAIVTPVATRVLGYVRWPAALLLGSAATQLLVLMYRLPTLVLAGLLLGFASQGIKICVDTVLQRDVDDEYLGRVFAVYDALFNITLVAAAVITAVALPGNGHAPASVVVIAGAYVATAVGYLRTARRPAVTAPATRTTT